MTGQVPALEISNLSKSYGATKALTDASFKVGAGHVHALLGENGAGKSTIIKLLSGIIQPDSGVIRVDGDAVELRGPRDAHRHGIQTAFQELTLTPHLSVLQNILIPYQPTGFAWQLKHRAARQAVREHLLRMNLEGIDMDAEVSSLSLSVRQKIEIARAIFRKPRVLFLDESTSALSGSDIDWLEGIIAQLRQEKVTIVFITHRMAEVRRFCDAVTVLRNGSDVGTFAIGEIEDRQMIELIIGRSLAGAFPPKPKVPKPGASLLAAQNIAAGNRLKDVSFDLRAGEVVGISALQGMGQQELFLSLFGDLPLRKGEILIDGKPVLLGSPQSAIAMGMGLVPEERKTEGLFLKLSGRENVLSPVLHRFSRFGFLDSDAETRSAAAVMQRVQIDNRAIHTPAGAFSGGNQQKLVLAKWLVMQTRILLLFDPCRGVDVGTKHEIYVLIRAFVEAGGAVLIHSTEIPELVNLCDRVLVMYSGQIAREVHGVDGVVDDHAVMQAALGENDTPSAGSTAAQTIRIGAVR